MRWNTRPSQWVGVAVIVGWTTLIAFGLPRIAATATAEEAVEAGTPVTLGGLTVTPPDGWTTPADAPVLLVLRKHHSQVTVFPGSPVRGDALGSLQGFEKETTAADPSATYHFTEPKTFTTGDGLDGAYAAALTSKNFQAKYVVVSDGNEYVILADGVAADWTSLHDELLTIATSLQISGGAS